MKDANHPLVLVTGAPDALLEFEVVSARLGGLSKTRVDELEKTDPRFPKRIPIGQIRANGRPARVAWLESEISAYVRDLVAQARSKSADRDTQQPA